MVFKVFFFSGREKKQKERQTEKERQVEKGEREGEG